MLNPIWEKIDITALLNKIVRIYTFGLAQFSRILTARLNCTIPQIISLFTLSCGKEMVWQWTDINGTFMPRVLADTNYRHVSHKNRGGQ